LTASCPPNRTPGKGCGAATLSLAKYLQLLSGRVGIPLRTLRQRLSVSSVESNVLDVLRHGKQLLLEVFDLLLDIVRQLCIRDFIQMMESILKVVFEASTF